MDAKTNKAYRQLILDINSAQSLTALWHIDRKIRAFIKTLSAKNIDDVNTIQNKLFKVSMTRHNNLIQRKS